MKKIIANKVYDTNTAKELGSWENTYNRRNFSWRRETLYRKKTGEYFLHGEGGPATNYAERVDNNTWGGGERIMPLTWAEARKWAEEHLDVDEYERIFGEVTEDESRVQVCYSISVAVAETIKRRAEAAGITASAYIEQMVQG